MNFVVLPHAIPPPLFLPSCSIYNPCPPREAQKPFDGGFSATKSGIDTHLDPSYASAMEVY